MNELVLEEFQAWGTHQPLDLSADSLSLSFADPPALAG